MPTRVAFRTAMRAAAVSMLNDFKAYRSLTLQIYPGRPRSINAPTAFVDRISERLTEYTLSTRQRVPTVELVVLHGLFDSKDAVEQGDDFVDAFLDWVADNYHSAGANTLISAVATEDDPEYVPTWQPPEVQRTYYATRISLEGFAST